jgi:hypothetical protein
MPTRHHFWFDNAKEFEGVRAAFGPKPGLPASYDDWLKAAARRLAEIEKRGWTVEKVVISAKDFVRFCDARGINRDLAALSMFAAQRARQPQKLDF